MRACFFWGEGGWNKLFLEKAEISHKKTAAPFAEASWPSQQKGQIRSSDILCKASLYVFFVNIQATMHIRRI